MSIKINIFVNKANNIDKATAVMGRIMFSRTQKKKRHPLFALGVGAMAIFGTYSLVTAACDMCREKMKTLMRAVKKHKCDMPCDPCDECED